MAVIPTRRHKTPTSAPEARIGLLGERNGVELCCMATFRARYVPARTFRPWAAWGHDLRWRPGGAEFAPRGECRLPRRERESCRRWPRSCFVLCGKGDAPMRANVFRGVDDFGIED